MKVIIPVLVGIVAFTVIDAITGIDTVKEHGFIGHVYNIGYYLTGWVAAELFTMFEKS